MNMFRKKVLISSLAIVIAIMLSACGGAEKPAGQHEAASPEGSGSDKKNVTLTFQNVWPDSTDPLYIITRQIVEQFENEHPHIKVELDTLNVDQQKLKLKTQAASKEMPDITIVNPAAQLKPYVEADLLLPLNDILERNGLIDTFQEGVLEYFSFDDQIYGLPTGNNIALVYYNKTLFEKAGVEVPTTFEEMIEAVKTFKENGILPMTIGEKDTWTGSFLFMNILLRTNEGPGFLQDVMDGKKTFEDPAFIEAVDAMKQLIDAGAFPDGVTALDYNSGENLFKTGQAAMYFMGSWSTGGIELSDIGKNGEVGIFKFPTVNGKGNINEFMLAPTAGLAIAKDSKHVEEAELFVNYYMLNYPQAAFETKSAASIAQKVDGDYQAAGYSSVTMELLELNKEVLGGDLAFDNTMNPGITQIHLSSIQNLFVSDQPAEAVAKEHQKAFEDNK